ncbi:MAG: PEP-CTERM sorting domain-containing protein [Planctomycetes bacterium]|nr:PEP-CTERM sorting domain-containing protein [Planctomycetota bacterium]
MKTHVFGGFVLLAMWLTSSAAAAEIYTFVPPDPTIGNLEHLYYYTWGIDRPWELGDTRQPNVAVAATLSFSQIYNWDDNPNVLYVHLLDDAPEGITTGWDNEAGGNYFDLMGTQLVVYLNLSTQPVDLTYTFTGEQVTALNMYAADGRFVLAFDPDCHFNNSGVELTILTELLPEPPVMVLMGAGALVGLWRRRR